MKKVLLSTLSVIVATGTIMGFSHNSIKADDNKVLDAKPSNTYESEFLEDNSDNIPENDPNFYGLDINEEVWNAPLSESEKALAEFLKKHSNREPVYIGNAKDILNYTEEELSEYINNYFSNGV